MGNKKSTPRTYLSEKDLLFLEANTRFNREKILEWHAAFLQDCTDGKFYYKLKIYKYNLFIKNKMFLSF